MAMARSFTESGSDEIRDVTVETCSTCAIDGKLQPATHFCFDCGVYGRCLCGDCLRKHNIFVGNHAIEIIAIQSNSKWKRLEKELSEEREKVKIQTTLAKDRERRIHDLEEERKRLEKEHSEEREKVKIQTTLAKDRERRINELEEERKRLEKELSEEREKVKIQTTLAKDKERRINELEKESDMLNKDLAKERELSKRRREELSEHLKESRIKDEEVNVLSKRNQDLQNLLSIKVTELYGTQQRIRTMENRFNKLTGANQNADIADMSDPNRAMKLSEKFGTIYDDEWTNAFEALTDKKIGLPLKDAIVFLLKLLQDSWTFCSDLLGTQMESLRNVFLHPAQDLSKIDPQQNVAGYKNRPRICSKNENTLREVRRQVCAGSSVIDEVKQVFLSDIKSRGKEKTGYQKKHIEECAPYILKCAEICWLMAVHDPPLYMKMDVKHGEKFDPNGYLAYSSSGNSIDFLVWPPLLYGKYGELLAKGVAEPLRTVGKKK